MPLPNAKHEAFARAIVEGKTAAAAYRAAGYASKGRAADANASRLIANDNIAARIAELKGEAAQAAIVTAARVLEELAKLAFANMADYMSVGPGGDPVLDFSKLTRDQAAALTEVTVEDFLDGRGEDARQVRKVKFKLADKRGPLVDLGKHLGLFKERVEHTGKDDGPIEVKSYTDIEAARLIGRLLSKVTKDSQPLSGDPVDAASPRS